MFEGRRHALEEGDSPLRGEHEVLLSDSQRLTAKEKPIARGAVAGTLTVQGEAIVQAMAVETQRHSRRHRRGQHGPKIRRTKGNKSKNAKVAVVGVLYTLKRTEKEFEGPIGKRVMAHLRYPRGLARPIIMTSHLPARMSCQDRGCDGCFRDALYLNGSHRVAIPPKWLAFVGVG